MVKHLIIGKIYVVGTYWNCLYEAIPLCTNNIVTENKETIFEFTLKPGIMSIFFASFNISSCQSVL